MDTINQESTEPHNTTSVACDSSRKSSSLGYPSMPPTPPEFARTPAEATVASGDAAATVPASPQRPKGRLFMATLLLAVFGYSGSRLYEGYVRYVAYGQVVGRKIQLASPWEGVIRSLHVRIGDYVRQGDPVFMIDSLEMRHRMEIIEDSLNLQRAQFESELARLKWEAERVEDNHQLLRADYYEKWSALLWEQSLLTDLEQKLRRAEKLSSADAFAGEQFVSLQLQVEGKKQRIAQLSQAVEGMKRTIQPDRTVDRAVNDQIKPALVRIENLQADLRRVRQLLDQRMVTCPANGRVTGISKYSGEHVDGSEAVIDLLIDGSTEIVLYLPQDRSNHWACGDQLNVCIEPSNRSLACEVVGLVPEMQSAPESIMRRYNAGDALLPIIVRPRDSELANQLILGSTVKLPRTQARPNQEAITKWDGRYQRFPRVGMPAQSPRRGSRETVSLRLSTHLKN